MATAARKSWVRDEQGITLPRQFNTDDDVLTFDLSGFREGYGFTTSISDDSTGGYRGVYYADGTTRIDFVSIERFDITATNYADTIQTGNGNDVIRAGGGNDVVIAGAGRDALDGGSGIDGFNKSFGALGTAVTVNLTTDSITASQGTIKNFEYFANVIGTTKNDVFVSSQARGNDIVSGGEGNDRAEFRVGDDDFIGGGGTDTLKADFSWWAGGEGIQMYFDVDGAGGFRGYYFVSGGQRVDFGSTENFEVSGTKNNDRIYGGSGNDIFSGNEGNDDVRSGSGVDTLDGGAGTDGLGRDFTGSTADITVNLQASTITAAFGTIAGFEYFIAMTGGGGNDTFVSTTVRADDNVTGGGGNDTATFYEGRDVFTGALGIDRLIVDYSASNTNKGIEMSFSVDGNGGYRGYYYLDGDTRSDFTSVENFTITGTTYNDRIITGDGDDTVSGGAGWDLISTGGGTDTVNGGAGIDGIGRNFLNAAQAISVNLNTNTVAGIGGAITNFEYFFEFVTGSGADVLVSTNALANDSVTTGGGDDTFTSYYGRDGFDGQLGTDRLVIDWSAVDLGGGLNGISQSVDSNGGYRGYFYVQGTSAWVDYASVEAFTFTGTFYGDTFVAKEGNDILNGGDGDDVLYAGSGNDTVDGGAGIDGLGKDMTGIKADITVNLRTDTLTLRNSSIAGMEYFADVRGGDGDDKFITLFQQYNDTVTGGGGNDTATFYGGADVFTAGSGSKDKLIVDYSDYDGEDRISSSVGVDNDNGGFRGYFYVNNVQRADFTGTEVFDITGTKNDDSINGGGGADQLDGGDGRDSLAGGGGADKLFGGLAADVIDGGEGADQITGGIGGDTMTGGTGADKFLFGANDIGTTVPYADRLVDFETGVDKIDLSAIDANTTAGSGGNQAFSFIGTDAFTGAGQLHIVNIGGINYLQGNVDDDLRADFTIRVDGSLPVATDIVL